jgi:hypothetical protein
LPDNRRSRIETMLTRAMPSGLRNPVGKARRKNMLHAVTRPAEEDAGAGITKKSPSAKLCGGQHLCRQNYFCNGAVSAPRGLWGGAADGGGKRDGGRMTHAKPTSKNKRIFFSRSLFPSGKRWLPARHNVGEVEGQRGRITPVEDQPQGKKITPRKK